MKPQYKPEEIVFLKTDPEKLPRMITAYKVTKNDITYECVCGTNLSWHYDIELSRDREDSTKIKGFGRRN